MWRGERLDPCVYISNGNSKLIMQEDGNLVLYNKDNAVLWASMTYNNIGGYAKFFDGTLTVNDKNNNPLYTSVKK